MAQTETSWAIQNLAINFTKNMRFYLHAKIHKATVTEANVNYVGSITIDQALARRIDLHEYERVLVVSNTSGARLETYVIYGEQNSGVMCMNGAAAHLIHKGEEIIVMAFELSKTPVTPRSILVDKHNRFVKNLTEKPGHSS